jgi:threonyl-tRNA synthetase
MINVKLKDGSIRQYEHPVSIAQIANDISSGLGRVALTGFVEGRVVDIDYTVSKDSEVSILTFDDHGGRDAYRHTTAHILAQAVKRLFPRAKLAIGPSIDNGFYYDFEVDKPFTPEDLVKIEEEMKKIIKAGYKLTRKTMDRKEAMEFFQSLGEEYKVELIRDLPEDEEISLYEQGEFTDLCAGPHVPTTDKIKAVKLLSVAGAYWRGNEKNKMLQRIYGTCFNKKSELEEYIHRLEEAKKRDHRKLGRELDLFSIQEEGPGFPFFHPKGMVLRNILEDFWRREHRKRGYLEVKTPIILNEQLWHKSGHWDHYKENMYFTNIDEIGFAVKPMNCPGAMLMYKRKMYSYRDLPIRMGELGLVHRHELSGALHGLMRVRCFTQDDAHIFMLEDQIKDEVVGVIDFIDYVYTIFGFKYHVELSTRPENSMGSDEQWEAATKALVSALERKGIKYSVNDGDGAFYGPKIDFKLEDSIGRTWQCGTIQLDFQMPERFDLSYIDSNSEKLRPVMVHRVIFGSIERFIAILVEHFAGAFPTWITPVQVKILPITDKHHNYCLKLKEIFESHEIRVEVDSRNEKIGYKIREAQLEKIPYMLVAGDKEVEEGKVSVRDRKEGDLGAMDYEHFINIIQQEIKDKVQK